MLVVRCLTNLFMHPAPSYVMLKKRQTVLDAVSGLAGESNKNLRQALFSLLLNYSVALQDASDKKESAEGRIQGISLLSECFSGETDL